MTALMIYNNNNFESKNAVINKANNFNNKIGSVNFLPHYV